MIQELLGRFGLVESEDEDDLIQMLSFCVDNPNDREGVRLYGTTSPWEDSELLTVAYMVRVSCSANPPSIDFSHYLLRWILVRVRVNDSNALCGVMQASISRLWTALERDEFAVTTTEYANHIFLYAEFVLSLYLFGAHTEVSFLLGQSTWTKILKNRISQHYLMSYWTLNLSNSLDAC
jgi:hypothetical protein